MLCVVIKGPTHEQACKQLEEAIPYADLVEFRLDFFDVLDLTSIKKLKYLSTIPVVFTLRSSQQGGCYTKPEKERYVDIQNLAKLKPDYFDLEHHLPDAFVNRFIADFPDIKVIISHHDFKETPQHLDTLLSEMRRKTAHLYKLAVMANCVPDTLRFVGWARQFNNIIAVSMGPHGQLSRIVGPFTYAPIKESEGTALGQIPAKTLLELYRYKSIISSTVICGLIGDPVSGSISHITHNHLMKELELDAVYTKMTVKPTEVADFLKHAKTLPILGLSVTMPLKEVVMDFLDHIDPHAAEIGAVNTLHFSQGKVSGYNTDGIGALNAIERKIEIDGKKVVIIGAGGSAKAVIHEAVKRGARVTVLNRDEKKAVTIAEKYGCQGYGLSAMASCAKDGCDILINCTPADLAIDENVFSPDSLVMDIRSNPMKTPFLESGLRMGCQVIYGYEMFVEQAAGQFAIWFKIPQELTSPILEKVAREYLESDKETAPTN